MGALLLAAAGTYQQGIEDRALWRGELKRCQECAETVRCNAKTCPHCAHVFSGDEGHEDLRARAKDVGAGLRSLVTSAPPRRE